MRAGLVAVPVNFKFPRADHRFHPRGFRREARVLRCAAPRRLSAATCRPCISAATARTASTAFLDPGPFDADRAAPRRAGDVPLHLGLDRHAQGRRALAPEPYLGGGDAARRQDLARHRYLIAAPLYHMNALALSQARLRRACHHRAAAAVHRARLYRGDRALSLHLAHRGAADDRDDAARERAAGAHRSLERRVRAHGLGAGEPEPDGGDPPRAAAGRRSPTPMARPKPARSCSARIRKGLPQPEMSVGYPHPKVQLRLVDGDNRDADQGVLEMKCPALMLGYHNRPDLTPPFTADGFYITGDVFRRDADGFHYFVGRTDDMFVSGGENIYPGDVERMLERHPDVAQAASCRSTTRSRDRSRSPSWCRSRAQPERGRDQALRARQRAGLSASALRLVPRRAAARLDQQGRPRALHRLAEERLAGRVS